MENITYSTIKDAEEIEILRGKSSFKYAYDEEEIASLKKRFALKDSFYILAKSEGKFAGFCSTDRGWWEEDHFFIREILVDPSFQKLGVGSELMRRCIDHARRLGAVGVVTETAFDNIPMQQLCAKLGFQQWDNPRWKEGITFKLLF